MTVSFNDLGLSPQVLAAVTAAGYTTPTPIQAQAIPHVLAHRDVLGIAQTGTGLVDAASGIESAPGVKDVDKIAAFCQAVRQI